MNRTFLARFRSRPAAIAIMASLSASASFMAPRPAFAWIPPPCEAAECPAGGAAWWSMHSAMILSALGLMEAQMVLQISEIKDRVTRLANANSQDATAENNAGSAGIDVETSAATAAAIGSTRYDATVKYAPSMTSCRVMSNQIATSAASGASRAQLRTAESNSNNLFSNAPGTPGESGQLSYLTVRFTERMSRYCNPATVNLPATVGTCSSTIGVDRDVKPFDSIFKLDNMAGANDYTAAKDVVLNLMGNVVADPVRGAVLSRSEGRNLAIVRNSEIAKSNLASGALMAMVERRRDASGAGKSTQSLNVSGSYADNSSKALAESNAAQNTPQNLRTIALLLRRNDVQYLAFRGLLEQYAALHATAVAMDIKQSSAQNPTASAISLRRD